MALGRSGRDSNGPMMNLEPGIVFTHDFCKRRTAMTPLGAIHRDNLQVSTFHRLDEAIDKEPKGRARLDLGLEFGPCPIHGPQVNAASTAVEALGVEVLFAKGWG